MTLHLSPAALYEAWPQCATTASTAAAGFSPPSGKFSSPSAARSPPHKRDYRSCTMRSMVHATTLTSDDISEIGREERERHVKIHYSLLLLAFMALTSALLALVSLVCFFLSVKSKTNYLLLKTDFPEVVETLAEIVNCLDVVVVVTSMAAFFCSSFQIYFVLRQLKRHPSDLATPLAYLASSSFTRVVVFSFWFLAVLAFICVVVLAALLSPTRGAVSKGVALSAGVGALVLCALALLKSAWSFSSPSSEPSTPSVGKYQHFSTLV